jgi:hypothetical protein
MDKSISLSVIAMLGFIYVTVWWLRTKGTPYRKLILKTGISWIITVIAFVFAVYFDLGPLFLISLIAFIAAFIFVIKAGMAEHRFKNQQYPD